MGGGSPVVTDAQDERFSATALNVGQERIGIRGSLVLIGLSPARRIDISRQAWAHWSPGCKPVQAFEVAASSAVSRFPSCSRFISASTISRIIVSKLISGTQPSFFLALDASPRKVSTSAGR